MWTTCSQRGEAIEKILNAQGCFSSRGATKHGGSLHEDSPRENLYRAMARENCKNFESDRDDIGKTLREAEHENCQWSSPSAAEKAIPGRAGSLRVRGFIQNTEKLSLRLTGCWSS